jgi:NDP-sugar pyrophosphorylase family protein
MAANLENITAAVLAGGLGTRLRPAVADRPKVLAPVRGRPYLAHLLDRLAEAGIRRVVLLTGHQAEQVRCALGEAYRSMELVHSPEPAPLGTAGAVRLALPRLSGRVVLVMNGDSWCEVDLAAFRAAHDGNAARLSLVLTRTGDMSRYGQVQVAADGRVLRFQEKGSHRRHAWISAGMYLMDRALIAEIPEGQPLSLEREVFPAWVKSGTRVYGFRGGGPFLDIGTPAAYAEADAFFRPLAEAR